MLSSDPIAEAREKWVEQGWEDAAPGLALIASLDRARQIYVSRVESILRPQNMSLARFELLMQLYFSPGRRLSLGRLRARLQVAPGAITNAMTRLEADGLVDRHIDPSDARVNVATLTAAGVERALEVAHQINREVFCSTDLSVAEMDELFSLLVVVRRRAGDFRNQTASVEAAAS